MSNNFNVAIESLLRNKQANRPFVMAHWITFSRFKDSHDFHNQVNADWSCGTAGCLLGTIALDPLVEDISVVLNEAIADFDIIFDDNPDEDEYDEGFATWLGVSLAMAELLTGSPRFYGKSALHEITIDDVIEALIFVRDYDEVQYIHNGATTLAHLRETYE